MMIYARNLYVTGVHNYGIVHSVSSNLVKMYRNTTLSRYEIHLTPLPCGISSFISNPGTIFVAYLPPSTRY